MHAKSTMSQMVLMQQLLLPLLLLDITCLFRFGLDSNGGPGLRDCQAFLHSLAGGQSKAGRQARRAGAHSHTDVPQSGVFYTQRLAGAQEAPLQPQLPSAAVGCVVVLAFHILCGFAASKRKAGECLQAAPRQPHCQQQQLVGVPAQLPCPLGIFCVDLVNSLAAKEKQETSAGLPMLEHPLKYHPHRHINIIVLHFHN